MRKHIVVILLVNLFLIVIQSTLNISYSASILEIFSWWTAGGEKEGLNSLYRTFNQLYPDTLTVNATVSGGAGINAKLVLKTRMLSGNPPDSFQVHAGSELIDTWVKSKYLKPLTDLWEEEGWFATYPQELINMVTYQGEIYAVPINIHRSNLVWYNKSIFDKLKIEPPGTLTDFFKVAQIIQSKGIIPLAIASKHKWPVSHLFESILVGTGGYDFYQNLIKGKISWKDERVKNSLKLLRDIMQYVNTDHSSLCWDEACQMVLEGKAAMTVMGTWAQGYFLTNGGKPGIDFNAIPPFGSQDVFIFVCDTFGLPRMAPHPENARRWLKMVGSREAQKHANLKFGSIPARYDIPLDDYTLISQQNGIDYRNSIRLPSIAHGSAVIEPFVSILNDELAFFVNNLNIDQTSSRLEEKAIILGLRKSTPE